MDKECDVCNFLKSPKNQILTTEYWDVSLSNNQAYFGRAFVTLRTHKSSLSDLGEAEWHDFETIVQKLEKAYKEIYGAEPLNWGCFMNNAYRANPAHPHVHWHIFPRYRNAPTLNGVVYDDPLFGEFYDDNAERLVDDNTVRKIASGLTEYLASR